MNILLRMAFNGTAYHGFQVQKNALAVCTVLQDAMQQLFGVRPDVKGCSRTDAGVHAREYCVNFWYDTKIPMAKLPLALNSFLPQDIRVFSAQLVPEDFHARYWAAGKEYEYVILNSYIDTPFYQDMYHRVSSPLDEQRMHQAGQYLVGKHDFSSFQSAGSTVQDTVRTVTAVSVVREGDWVRFRVSADGFLYNMVRIMAGTLLSVGDGHIPPQAVQKIIAAKDRAAAGITAPAKGLFLNKVFYEEPFAEGKQGVKDNKA